MAPKPQNDHMMDTVHEDDITTTNTIIATEEEEHSPSLRKEKVTLGDDTDTTEVSDLVTSENMLRVRRIERKRYSI
jgi:hypothetical protein